MDDPEFQKHIREKIEAERLARRALGVAEGASPEEIKRAWRRSCLEHHPDRNRGDPAAQQRFRVVNGAYQLLARRTWSEGLVKELRDQVTSPIDERYNVENAWGFFLWWRDKFF